MPSRLLILPLLAAFMIVSAAGASAQAVDVGAQPMIAQPSDAAQPSAPNDSSSFTISAQPADAPQGHANEIPQATGYTPSASNGGAPRSFVQGEGDGPSARELGMTLEPGQRAYDEVLASSCAGLRLSHRAPESYGTARIRIRGLEVIGVQGGGPAASAGLRGRIAADREAGNWLVSWLSADRSVGTGDLIVRADGWPTSSLEDLEHVIRNTAAGGSILLTVVRPSRDDEEPSEHWLVVRLPSDSMNSSR